MTATENGAWRRPKREPTLVTAAGAVIWRLGARGLEVVLVHRPSYDDWSWPKGKLERHESYPAAGVREVMEETGLRVQLGPPLPSAHYKLSDNSSKTVHYWAARGTFEPLPAPPRPREVDRVEWVSVDEATRRLSRRGDRLQLEALVEAHDRGGLDTFPLIVVRHGHARPRNVWGREDSERPLVDAGRNQALNLVDTLAAWQPLKLVSSPWARCMQTLHPVAKATGWKVKTKGKLSEDGHRKDRNGTMRVLSKQIAKGQPAVLCTHRPVLGTVLGVLAGYADPGLSSELPRRDPFLEPGELLVAHVNRRSHKVVAVERHTTSPERR